ncbi:hypothetical protein NESM_000524300 [Novymonas esmeraldas]|uniref:Uncharacterized protein n=1 Tax=Novymonas esmeraldas TaxID=1808958 RepID=A0AAW0EQD1_9TRYP
MSSMSKLVLAVAAIMAAAMTLPAAAQATTAAPVPVNLGQNIVATVLILGVTIAVSLIYVLWKLIPKIRSGEVAFSKIEFDWRAELLNATPKKEKARRAAEKARREEELAAGRYRENDESGIHYSNSQPRVELRDGDVAVPGSHREAQTFSETDAAVKVTVPRE